jgi:hypothetical protein
MNNELLTMNNELRTTNYQLNTSEVRQATCDEFALFWSFYVSFCEFCASLRLKRIVFTRLLNKAVSMALWTKAITCDKAGFKSRFCQEHQAGKNIISVNPVILSNFSSCPNVFVAKNPCNPGLINDLRSTKDYVRKNNLFMQNKANFKKVKLNVNKVLTRNYDQLDTWLNGKNKANSKPIQSQLKPIKCQNKPNTNPNKPNFKT